jgi:sporulation protein YlmC with PRC-barrel domain
MATATEQRRVLSAATIVGERVHNPQGDDLGKVEALMIELVTGRVAYVVLSFGGFLGVGNKLFAIPWSALSMDQERKECILNVDKETLDNAPGFDKEHWPDMSDTQWATEVHAHYGARPYWEEHKSNS